MCRTTPSMRALGCALERGSSSNGGKRNWRGGRRLGAGKLPNPQMQPTGRGRPDLRAGTGPLEAEQWKRWLVRAPA